MGKLLLKSGLKLAVLLIVVLVMALYMSKTLRPDRPSGNDDTKSKVLGFYELKNNSIDILFMGSSHMYYAVNPAVINQKTDLNSYVFAGECQPIEVTYYFLKDALVTQSPKLVVLDVFGLTNSINACKTEGIIRVNLENLKTGSNKVEAYKDLFGEENLIYNIFDVSLYHNRWYEIFNEKSYSDNNFGYSLSTHFSDHIVDYNFEYSKKSKEVDLEYLDKISELCKDNGIELLLIKTPYYLSEEDFEVFNYLKSLYPDFIDFNFIRDDINYIFDIDGDVWHANVRGASKISEYLADYIDKYHISKTSDIYDEEYYDLLVKVNKAVYPEDFNLENVINRLKDNNHILLMNYNYFEADNLSDSDKEVLNSIGYDFESHDKQKAIYKVENKKVEAYFGDEYFYKEFILGDNTFKVESNGYMWKNGEGINIANNYACITVIDEKRYEVLDSFCMDTLSDLYIHRDREE